MFMPMSKSTLVKESSVTLAILDFIPVLIFGFAMVLMFVVQPHFLFKIGALLCVCAGLGKVIYKTALALKKKVSPLFSNQFRYTMPIGILCIIISFFVNPIAPPRLDHPTILVMALTGIAFILVRVLGGMLDMTTYRNNLIAELCQIINMTLLLNLAVILCASYISYSPETKAMAATMSDEKVTVIPEEPGYLFDGPGTEDLFVFYPGALVEPESYAPLLHKLAEQGVDAYLIRMPLNLALFGEKKIEEIPHSYNNVYIGGHSLGGVMASGYAADHPEIKGLVLLASYSTDQINTPTLSIRGEDDGVMNMDNYTASVINYVGDFTEEVIKGGNHSQFGDYGFQNHDSEASISADEQWKESVRSISSFINEHK